jgi:hypothetical protein
MEMTYSQLQNAVRTCFSKEKRINFKCKNDFSSKLSKDGIVIIDNFISEDFADKIYKDVKKLINSTDISNENIVYYKNAQLVNRGNKFKSDFNMIDIFDINNALTYLDDIIDKSFIANIIKEANGEEFPLKNFNIYYNNEVAPRCLHVDNFSVPQYKAFIYLTDVNEIEDGPYCYVKGSHLCQEKKIKSYINNFLHGNYLTDMREYSYDDTQKNLAKKGTLIISDQNGVHGAFPQEKGRERMLIMLNFSRNKISVK